MSDLEESLTPREWIRYLRAEHGLTTHSVYHIPDDALDDLVSHIPEQDRKKAREVWVNRRGRPAYEIFNELMADYLDQIKHILKPEEREIFDNTYFALLPIMDFNGYAGFTPKGDRVIVLHEAIGYTLNYWSHWYLRLMEEGETYFSGNPRRFIGITEYIADVWYGNRPTGKMPDIYPSTMDSWELQDMLTLSAISFVIGHEIGHILHKHSGYSAKQEVNHAMKYEADRAGLSIAIRHSMVKSIALKRDNYSTKFGLFAPLFAIGVIGMFGNKSSLTHPSASQRAEKILSCYADVFKEIFREHSETIWDEIDPNMLDILSNNSAQLLDIAKLINSLNSLDRAKSSIFDFSWLVTDKYFRKS